jgi:transcriptional regulator
MTREPTALLQGNLDLLVLRTLSWGPRHGYAVGRWIEETTDHVLRVEAGSLYPALYRLERKGLIEAEWGVSDLGRPAKLYQLTKAGRSRLAAETAAWRKLNGAIGRLLEARG